jgi:molybdopterin/thiamine biosynthesis adenylyltransferase/rhodanese-related sulfurtransferase
MFTDNEITQYSRHFTLPQVGRKGQLALKNSRVLCIGAGGLGAPILLYLAAAGVGTIGIVDDDVVDLSNLQRQVLYTQEDIGKPKAEAARKRLKGLNPGIDVTPYVQRLTKENALKIIANYDIVVDGTDNFASRYLINDACFTLNKPNVYGSIFQFEGQCSVFLRDKGPCYRCLFPDVPNDFAPNCAEAGVLGVLPGLLGCIQANEVMKLILGIGQPLIGQLMTVEALSMDVQKFEIEINPSCELCHHQKEFMEMDYDELEFCAVDQPNLSINLAELRAWEKNKERLYLLDVRDLSEHQEFNIGGVCIPVNQLRTKIVDLDPTSKIIAYCDVGEISKTAVSVLRNAGFPQSFSLSGGILGLQDDM